MKPSIASIIAILLGLLLGFFGVLNSVFTDAGLKERLTTIGVIILVYLALGGLGGFFVSGPAWSWFIALCLPGVVFLGLYMLKEFNYYYLVYMLGILLFAGLGTIGGKKVRQR